MTTDSENSPQIERKQKQRSGSKSPEPSKRRKRDESPPGKGRSDKKKSHKSKRSRSRSRSKDRKDKRHKYHDLDKPVEDEYPRYYGEDLEERLNSDRYWTKYPRKDNNVIGSRYYSAEANKEADKAKMGHGEEADKASKGGDKAAADKSVVAPRERKAVDMLTSRTGGAYIPPAKLRLMQAEITDKTSAAYQRIAWEALKKSIHGFINKVNTSNIGIIARELLQENVVRGRGLLCKSIIQAQAASPTFTNVYSALVAVINSKFPNIGELLLKRLVLQFKRGFKQNNKVICISATTFVAHLVNQRVAHEILALEILTLLVESPTDDSVEVAISFLKECGQKLTEVSSKGINAIFEMLRNILHEGQLEKRIQYMIEVMFQVRKDGFKDHAAIIEELDLVDEEHQFTHLITLDDVKQVNSEEILNVFKFDDNYEENEGKYKTLSKEILDQSGSESEGESGSGSEDDDDDDEDEEGEAAKSAAAAAIIDNTETNLIALRRTIYLTIQSSLDFEESAHKLMKMELKPGQEIELCHMFLDCCAEQRTYEKFYGLLAQRFCQVNRIYIGPFQQIFKDTYSTTHRLDTNKLRNVSKFFAHLMFTDAIGWEVLDAMKLNEEDTNSSNRIFIKILFQELAEYMGLEKLNTRLKDPTLQVHFSGLFPRDDPKNTRFAINFFTSIGLGGLTAELREHLKNAPKVPTVNLAEKSSSSDSSGSSSSSSSSEESSDESGSSSSSSDEEARKKRSVKKKKKSEGGKGEKKRERRSEDKGSSSSRRRKDSVSSKQSSKKEEGGSSKRHDDRSKKHEEKARRHEDRARGAEEKARRHEDKPRRDEDRARRDEDRARKSRDEGRRKRSPEERHRSRRH